MSKFFLHGGNVSPYVGDNISFWREIADSVDNDRVFVQSIGYAITGNLVALGDRFHKLELELATDVFNILSWINPHKVFFSAPAPSNPINLTFRGTDVIFVHGGNGDLLQDTLRPIQKRFSEAAKKITCAGNSAGANIFSHSYYSNDNRQVCDGYNILPVKTFCHYDTYKWPKLNELINDNPNKLDIIPLADNDYVVYEI